MNNENLLLDKNEEEFVFDFNTVLAKLFIYWKWLAVSVVICLCLAFFYIQKQAPVYRIQAMIMINDEFKGSFQNQMQSFQRDFGIVNPGVAIDNEVQVIHSRSVVQKTVMDLGLYVNYSIDNGIFRPDSILYGAYPLKVLISEEDVERLLTGFSFEISQSQPGTYLISYACLDEEKNKAIVQEEVQSLPCLLNTPIGDVLFSKGEIELTEGKTMTVSILPPELVARSCLNALSVEPTSKTTSIANVSYLDVNKKRGVDFVNQLVHVYNREHNNEKNIVAIRTEEFLKKRIEKVGAELDEAEEQVAQYKRSSGLINFSGDAQRVLQGSSEYEKQHAEVTTQLRLINFIYDYVNDPKNNLQPIPANVGLTDASLSSLIGHYNNYVLERNNLLRTASESNPAVIDATAKVRLTADAIKTSIESLQSFLKIKIEDFERQTKKYGSKLDDAPTQEKILAGYQRQLEVKIELYMMLLQKLEENSIALAATADNAKMLDSALAFNSPVSPKRGMIWLVALVLGAAFPIGIIYLKEIFRYKIEGRNDLEKLTTIPILGDVAISNDAKKSKNGVVVHENVNNLMSETFRAIRTNLQFVLKEPTEKVILFTSSTSGEGKTFVSSNLATSIALLGKKVILLGLDIRKPRLVEMFGLSDRKKGMSMFLAANADDRDFLFDQIMPSGINDNLDILPAGLIPPNPAELLSRKNLDNAIEFLKEVYDYIILDTAPLGLVSDALITSRVADVAIYVCRADYTLKSDLELANTLYRENKLKNMSIVLNGIDMTKHKYGYLYGYGSYNSRNYGKYYGYGKYGKYGHYGYGNETK